MKLSRILPAIVLTILPAMSSAQVPAPLEPSQMPARTQFYFVWRGLPNADARKTNALLSLWDDPDFAPVRSAFGDAFVHGASESTEKKGMTLSREDLEQYLTLIENPFVIGSLRAPEDAASSSSDKKWNGIFMVYDRTGKEALFEKAVLGLRAAEKDPPKVSTLTMNGVQVLKFERATETSYWAETGKYAITTSETAVFQEILARLSGKRGAGATLTDSSAYQEAKPLLGNGIAEVFFSIPDLKNIAPDKGPNGISISAILDAAKVSSVHSLCATLTLDGARTHIKGAVLGEVAPGTPFDLFSDGQAMPSTLALASKNTIYYNETQFNFLGLYNLIKNAYKNSLPEDQRGGVDFIEAVAQAKIGMPLPDAIGLLTGEFASFQDSPVFDPTKNVFAIGIHKKPEVLKLIHTLAEKQVAAERTEGEITYLRFSTGTPGAGTAGNSYHLAITPHTVLFSANNEALREMLSSGLHDSAQHGGLSTSPAFQQARATYPEKVNGLSFFDLEHLDWNALKESWIADAKKDPSKSSLKNGHDKDAPQIADSLKKVDPSVFPRHLHHFSSGSWKDAKGLHFDGWLD